MRKPIPALVGSLVRSSFICGLELEEQELGLGNTVTPRVCCPAGGLSLSTVTLEPNTDVDQQEDLTDLQQHPGAAHLAGQDACGISLVHDLTDEVSGVAGLGQHPWLAILGNITSDFTNTNNNCLGVLIGPQVFTDIDLSVISHSDVLASLWSVQRSVLLAPDSRDL